MPGVRTKKTNDAVIKISRMASSSKPAVMRIDKEKEVVSIRPKHDRREYVVTLSWVAQMIVDRVTKIELQDEGMSFTRV